MEGGEKGEEERFPSSPGGLRILRSKREHGVTVLRGQGHRAGKARTTHAISLVPLLFQTSSLLNLAWTGALSWVQDRASQVSRHNFLKGKVTSTEHFKQAPGKLCLHTRWGNKKPRPRPCSQELQISKGTSQCDSTEGST